MATSEESDAPLLCPSSQPEIPGSRIFGVYTQAPGEPPIAYLKEAAEVTDAMLALTAPLDPTRVLRIAAPCQQEGCPHYEGRQCTLAPKVVAMLPDAVDELIPCAIRKTCRWFVQEGKAICLRCPAIATVVDHPSSVMQAVADTRVRLPVVR